MMNVLKGVMGGKSGDPLAAYVKLLLRGEGASITDDTGKTMLVQGTTPPVVSSTAYKYGSKSIYGAGSSSNLYTAHHADFNVGTGDFCIDFWIKTSQTGYASVMGKGNDTGTVYSYVVQLNATSGTISFLFGGGARTTSTVAVNDGNWHHVACSRGSNTYRCFIDGAISGTPTTASASADNTQIFSFIAMPPATYYNKLTGYLDNVRFTNGHVRYSSDFTPPNEGEYAL